MAPLQESLEAPVSQAEVESHFVKHLDVAVRFGAVSAMIVAAVWHVATQPANEQHGGYKRMTLACQPLQLSKEAAEHFGKIPGLYPICLLHVEELGLLAVCVAC